MADLRKILNDLDFSALPESDNKLNECAYFYGLLLLETNRNQFRWLLGAFLNSCYGYLEYKAEYFHYAYFNTETGEPVKDRESLETLRRYVRVFENKNKSGFIKTSGLSDLMSKLYKFRAVGTHDGGLGIMEVGDNLPDDFHIGDSRGKGIPALKFCEEVMAFFSALELELNE